MLTMDIKSKSVKAFTLCVGDTVLSGPGKYEEAKEITEITEAGEGYIKIVLVKGIMYVNRRSLIKKVI